MIFLEMSRDEEHGGGTWRFPNCLWAPTEKKDGKNWPFWNKVHAVKSGDTIVHLRGKRPNAHFVGFSTASTDGYIAGSRPPVPGDWAYSPSFFKADLKDFQAFDSPINLDSVFQTRGAELEKYALQQKDSSKNIFYVKQGGRLQCLNGAYLTDLDERLLELILVTDEVERQMGQVANSRIVSTGSNFAEIKTRIGQSEFSNRVKDQYGSRCCFPGCSVNDRRFLIGAHISRWSDNENLRGNIGNGLSLCLTHDKAFEIGMFCLDNNFSVIANPSNFSGAGVLEAEILRNHGNRIKMAPTPPLLEALEEHRQRIGL